MCFSIDRDATGTGDEGRPERDGGAGGWLRFSEVT